MGRNLPGLENDVYAAVKTRLTYPVVEFLTEESALCQDLDQELMTTKAIGLRAPAG